MGREVRMVPADWEHPTDGDFYIPLFDGYTHAVAEWEREHEEDVERPLASSYVPDWPAEQRTHFQYYENTSEGSPLSPVFATIEELAQWLFDNDSKHNGSSYESWLNYARHSARMTAESTWKGEP